MQWVEMIQVRPTLQNRADGEETLRNMLEEFRMLKHLASATIWIQPEEFGDVAAVLLWDNDRRPVKTREGYLLAGAMARYGSVSHVVWQVCTGPEGLTS